jgi:AcrR family transcriptional regulator
MPRWEPQARDRLRDAALELFLAHGFDNVTVAQITERAGLTRRTFSRYFTDKRDVLFAGSEQLPAVLAAAVGRADPDLAPFTALLTALTEVGDLVADEHAAERRAIVQASPELQERGLTKDAAVTSALAAALEQRGAEAATAALLAPVGTAIFRAAFGRWAEQPESASLADRIRETAAELAANMQQPAAPPSRHRSRPAAPPNGGVVRLALGGVRSSPCGGGAWACRFGDGQLPGPGGGDRAASGPRRLRRRGQRPARRRALPPTSPTP